MIIEMLIAMLIVLIMCGFSAVIGFFVGYKVKIQPKARDEPEPLTPEQEVSKKKLAKELENFYSYSGTSQP